MTRIARTLRDCRGDDQLHVSLANRQNEEKNNEESRQLANPAVGHISRSREKPNSVLTAMYVRELSPAIVALTIDSAWLCATSPIASTSCEPSSSSSGAATYAHDGTLSK